VWPEDVPEDVLTGGGEPPAAVPPSVKDSPSGAVSAAAAPPAEGEPRPKRASHLKLVE
jgi:hypothetical protein